MTLNDPRPYLQKCLTVPPLILLKGVKFGCNLLRVGVNVWSTGSLMCLMPKKTIWGPLHDMVPFVQFKKHEKHPWKNVAFIKVAGSLLHLRFSRFLNYTNGTKSRNLSHTIYHYANDFPILCKKSDSLVKYMYIKRCQGVKIIQC